MRLASFSLLAILSVLTITPRASAQVTLAQDTLSMDSPAAASCGFCGTEGFGVVFRDLPAPARGLLAEDFPLTLRSVEIAIAAARLNGMTCMNIDGGGTVLVDVEIWGGVTPPGETIGASAPAEPWPGTSEELVFAAADVPIELSIPASGATGFNLQLNRFEIMDEMGLPLRVSAPITYLRVYVQLRESTLPGPAGCMFSSDGSPLRDDDGRIAEQRSYILADGMGFAWNEDVGVDGDWAVRLNILPTIPPPTDAGPRPDAGAATDDAGASAGTDSGAVSAIDAGTTTSGGGGCACRAGRSSGRADLALLALGSLALAFAARRRR